MPPSIWTRCAGAAEIRPLALRAHRCVEAQHRVATRKLVDSREEQELLEQLIDAHKPPWPAHASDPALHYLLRTSFRYPPLRHGSRFGTRGEPALWYGAEALHTAFAESAYYRLVFLDGTAAALERVEAEVTTFHVPVRTDAGIDLAAAPFLAHEAAISSPVSYAAAQELGRAMRAAGVLAFRYLSARDPQHGVNVGVFEPRAFAAPRPAGLSTWHCTSSRSGVEFVRKDFFRSGAHAFPRSAFEVDGRLPSPAP